MAFKVADRVFETTTTTGTGTVSLGGAVTGYQRFQDIPGVASADVVPYIIEKPGTTEWETGYGTLTSGSPWTLTRTTVIASSNSNAAVNFSAGTKNVFLGPLATKVVMADSAGAVALPGALSVPGAAAVTGLAQLIAGYKASVTITIAAGASYTFRDDGTENGVWMFYNSTNEMAVVHTKNGSGLGVGFQTGVWATSDTGSTNAFTSNAILKNRYGVSVTYYIWKFLI